MTCRCDGGGVDEVVGKVNTQKRKCSPPQSLSSGPLPLVSSVLVSAEPSGQVEGAVGGQPGVHPLGKVEDLGRRERFPVALLPLEPALAAACRTLLPTPEKEEKKKKKKS